VSDRLRWGIIGTGNIARQFATGVIASRRGKIAAAGSRQLTSAESFARTFHVPQAFGSYDEVLRSPEVDVVYISLPNSMHHEWTVAALSAGKHVLCEKPLARTAAEAEQMFEAAQRSGRILMEAFMYRSHPQTLAVLEAVRSGAIGAVKLIRTSFCYRTRRVADNIHFSRELAGGALMDVGCYCTDFSRVMAGAEPISANVAGHVHENGVDDYAAATLEFGNGVVASFTCGMTVQADNTAYVCGSEGFIEVPVPWKPMGTTSGFSIVRGTPPRMDTVGQSPPATPPREPRVVSAPADPFTIEADDFAAIVLDGQPPRVTPGDSLGNMRVLDELRRQLGVL
jgi:predicted dehydrogenase